MEKLRKIKTTRKTEKKLETLSPFELKDKLISLAKAHTHKSASIMLNAGRGNPNWISTKPREAFFTLGLFALEESKRTMHPSKDMAGMPKKNAIAKRFGQFLHKNKALPGVGLLKKSLKYGTGKNDFNADEFVHELTDSIIGDNYPTPARMLPHFEAIVQNYLDQEMCNGKPPKGKYDLFAVEGSTAGMCYIFDSLMQNFLVKRGDKIALLVPIFTPYIEIPTLDRNNFEVININASGFTKDGLHTWQYPDAEIDKLKDPSIKIVFVVNPSNPPSYAIHPDTIKRLIGIVKNDNPGMMVISDDVYGTFVPGFRSLMAELPQNTLCAYSFSKYFGCTGWRLGVVVLHQDNIFDKKIAGLTEAQKKVLHKRYGILSLHPEKIKFIDRMVADSRAVALNHTAGLSLPQQAQMALFSLFALLDEKGKYKKMTQDLIQKRLKLLWTSVGFTLPADPLRAGYYAEIDMMLWSKKFYGKGFAGYMKKHFDPVDILFRLAEKTSIVLLNGGGFSGPEWSIRVSLANLDTPVYSKIGKTIAEMLHEYAAAWKGSSENKHNPLNDGRGKHASHN
ncbi:MAG: aspartate 4-decarboxylase [Bacteroidales bacterium]|jgi:aspartate 4-decarboxylase